MTETYTGGCVCGSIRFVCEAEPLLVAHCHCRDCQKSSGAAFATVVVVPRAAFRLLQGEPAGHPYRGDSGKRLIRQFCGRCGAPLFTEAEAMPDARIIRAAAFDDPARFVPQMHIYTASASIPRAPSPGTSFRTICPPIPACRRCDPASDARSFRAMAGRMPCACSVVSDVKTGKEGRERGIMRSFTRILVANRGEIAIRVMRAATELGMRTVGVYAHEDRFSLHRFKADESYLIGRGKAPVEAYLDMADILRVAREAAVDAIHPGYGFLSENPDFARACEEAGIAFIGPRPELLEIFGNKMRARQAAEEAGLPVLPASGPLSEDPQEVRAVADALGYPLMLKASWGGGGRGMRIVAGPEELASQLDSARREAEAAFGRGTVYLERLVRRARHVEVQLLGDRHGTVVHLFERDCSLQRRNQKVIERAPAPYLSPDQRQELCAAAVRLGEAVGYDNAGTVEFLMDVETGAFHFIEVNPRIQVEHTVTEEVTGIDLVKAQIRIAEGARIGSPESGVPAQSEIRLNGHAIQCRITSEDPERGFAPDYGRIHAYRGATGFGIRLDGGIAFSGAIAHRHFDSLLEKVTAWAPTPEEAARRMDRALREFRIRGIATNLAFLENVINHPAFLAADYTTRFIEETPELFRVPRRRDRASKLLRHIGEVTVRALREKGATGAADGLLHLAEPPLPDTIALSDAPPPGTRQQLAALGPEKFARWMREERRVLITDTTMRDAHQSLFATRLRSHDMLRIAPYYAHGLPGLFSLECWGGATFDVALRFLKEDPWERLSALRARIPNILLQMLLRGANAVGYRNYPDNVVRLFVREAAEAGIDLFRVFDSLNWVENMRVAMDAVLDSGRLLEGTICYTGDVLAGPPNKYDLKYYLSLAREIADAGAHILGIKDMAGVARPAAIRTLVRALREEVGLPIHFHTHDTSGLSSASVLAAIEAGVDAVDVAMDSMSGLTSQPPLGSLVKALEGSERDPGLDWSAIRAIARYWEQVRPFYRAFEADIRSGTSEVYHHAMPGGQYTNLRQQAASLGLAHRWDEVADMYAAVNELFGDIVKVTPTSKVVGDMALFMLTNGLTIEDVRDPDREIAFPDSVIAMLRGELGQPPGGWPPELQRKALKGEEPITERPGALLPPADLEGERRALAERTGRSVDNRMLLSHLLYPEVLADYLAHDEEYGPVTVLPTPVFFDGLREGAEVSVELERGKTLVIRLLAIGDVDENGERKIFFELNGQPRMIRVREPGAATDTTVREKADPAEPGHVAAPMPGTVVAVQVAPGDRVNKDDPLLSIEAMKMETRVRAPLSGRIARVLVSAGDEVETKDLLLVIEPA